MRTRDQQDHRDDCGDVCPLCQAQGDDVLAGRVSAYGGMAYQVMHCQVCAAIYENRYSLTSYDLMDD